MDLIKAKEMLETGKYTCVVINHEQVYTSEFRGVKPLVSWYASDVMFTGFSAADKVIGKATAFLYILLDIKVVYAGIISQSALELLKNNGIEVTYGLLVENIINRKGDGICPFEMTVLDCNDKFEAYKAIRNKMEEMGISL